MYEGVGLYLLGRAGQDSVMLDELVVHRPVVVQYLMGVGRLVVQQEHANAAHVGVVIEIDDEDVQRRRPVAVRQDVVELPRRLGGELVEADFSADELLQQGLIMTRRVKYARLLACVLQDAVHALVHVFVHDITAEIEVLLRQDAHVRIEIQYM